MGLRRKRLFSAIALLLLGCPPVWSSPDTTMTIAPSAVSGDTIDAADENDRNSDISTAYNNHSHTDISQVGNTLNVGSGSAGNKTLCANAADASDRCLQWNDTSNLWTANQPDTANYNQLLVASGTSLLGGTNLRTGEILITNGKTGVATSGMTIPNGDRVYRTAGDVTTTSTSLVDFTGASITLATSANPVLVGFSGTCSNSTLSSELEFGIEIDGAAVTGTVGLIKEPQQQSGGSYQNCSFTFMSADLTASSHQVDLQWSVNANTGTVECDTGNPCIFWVQEVTD